MIHTFVKLELKMSILNMKMNSLLGDGSSLGHLLVLKREQRICCSMNAYFDAYFLHICLCLVLYLHKEKFSGLCIL